MVQLITIILSICKAVAYHKRQRESYKVSKQTATRYCLPKEALQ